MSLLIFVCLKAAGWWDTDFDWALALVWFGLDQVFWAVVWAEKHREKIWRKGR